MISIKKAILISIILVNTTILSGCANSPFQHTPHFFKTANAPIINYHYPKLTSIKTVNETLNHFVKTPNLSKQFNDVKHGETYLKRLYQSVPLQTKDAKSMIDKQLKSSPLNAKQRRNYLTALKNVRPNEHQIIKSQKTLLQRFKHQHLSKKTLQSFQKTFTNAEKTYPSMFKRLFNQLFNGHK